MSIKRILMAAWITGLLLVTASSSLAATQSLLTPSGDLFVVEEVFRGDGPSVALRSTIYRASGERQGGFVPATLDRVRDGFPTLALDPDTGRPALVWSRFNGSDYGLVLSVHDGRRWSAPIPLVDTVAHEIHARAFSAPGEGIHVIWRHPGQTDSFYYGLFRTGSGVPVRGPERVTPFLIPGGSFTEGGGDDPGIGRSEPPPADSPGDGDECAGNDRKMCKESASPVSGKSGCQAMRVGAVIGDAVCVVSRDAAGWSRGPCAPVGSVDVRAALESMGWGDCGR